MLSENNYCITIEHGRMKNRKKNMVVNFDKSWKFIKKITINNMETGWSEHQS